MYYNLFISIYLYFLIRINHFTLCYLQLMTLSLSLSHNTILSSRREIETGIEIERSKVREPATSTQRGAKDFNWRVCSISLLFLSLSIYIYNSLSLSLLLVYPTYRRHLIIVIGCRIRITGLEWFVDRFE